MYRKHAHSCRKLSSYGNSFFSVPKYLILMLVIYFSLKNVKQGQKLQLTCLYACWIMLEAPFANVIKLKLQTWPEMPLILGRSGTQYVAMVTRLLSSYCGAHYSQTKWNVPVKNTLINSLGHPHKMFRFPLPDRPIFWKSN